MKFVFHKAIVSCKIHDVKKISIPKPIPEFKSEEEEREFWANHDSAEYVNWEEAKETIFPKLKPATKTISLRMSESMLNELKLLANRSDVPYQSLIKIFLRERIDKDLHRDLA